MRTPPALRLELRRSRIGAGLAIGWLLMAEACLLAAPLAWPFRALLATGFLVCAGWQLWRLGYGPAGAGLGLRALAWSQQVGWRLQARGERDWRTVELLPGGMVHAWLCGLRFREPAGERRHEVLLFADSSDRESLRQLRVLWRYELSDVRKRSPMS